MAAASFKSFVEMFHHRIKSTPDSDAFYYRKDGNWQTMLWKDVGRRVRHIACGLRSLGIAEEQRVSILSGTRVEWILCDLGILCAGGATTTIYPSSTAEDTAYILSDSGSRFALVEDDKQVDKVLSVRAQVPELKGIIVMNGKSRDDFVISLADLEQKGDAWDKANPGRYEAIGDAVGPEHIATLIYTSGTTGKPKGVILTHDSWVYEGEAIDSLGLLSPADKQYLWLPLAHSFGKVLEAAVIRIGIPTAVDGVVEELVANLAVVQPTFMGAVPRIFEKVYNKVISGAKEGGGLKYQIFTWSVGVGREVSALRQKGQEPSGFLALKYSIADKLVFSKLKARFGGKLRFFISGAAPLSREIAEFFHACGIMIFEGYGLTETSAASFVNRPDKFRFGTVGAPVPGTEVKIAEDGEILIKGRGVMRGYYNMPEETAKTIKDGWLYTGDIGQVEDGLLRITDRKKDLIKTSGGKYVAPQEIENKLKTRSSLIGQALVHGNNRNFCSAILTLNVETTISWAKVSNISLAELGGQVDEFLKQPNNLELAAKLSAVLCKKPEVLAEISRVVEDLNKELASYESIKKFAVVDKEFSLEDGLLTPSLKIKRKAVEDKYRSILDGFYQGSLADR